MRVFDYFAGFLEGEETVERVPVEGDVITLVKGKDYLEVRYNEIAYSRAGSQSIYTNAYWDYFTMLPLLYADPKVLLIGLGGGTIPLQLYSLYEKISLDAIENSEKMVKIAEKFVELCMKMSPDIYKRYQPTIYNEDGFKYLMNTKNKYDIIMLDAYVGSLIPNEFISETFVSNAFEALGKNGMLAINYSYNPISARKFFGLISMLKKRFKVYSVNEPIVPCNIVIICSKEMDKNTIYELMEKRVKNTGAHELQLLKKYNTMRVY